MTPTPSHRDEAEQLIAAAGYFWPNDRARAIQFAIQAVNERPHEAVERHHQALIEELRSIARGSP